MTTSTKAKSAPDAKRAAPTPNAIALLRADHKAVRELFDKYESARSSTNKKSIVAEICTALSVHAQIEDEIFYPVVKVALKDKLLVPEATVEHAGIKDLVAQLDGSEPDGEMYDAKVKVLSEYVKHHVKEEQDEMFPKVKGCALDLDDLGARMAQRKSELLAARK